MTSRVRNILRIAAPLVIAAIVAAGCGSDDDDASADSGPTTTARQLTGEPIKLGMIGVLSGPAFNPGRVEGAKAAAKAINDAGGIDGRPIEIVACDSGLSTVKPTGAIDCATDAIKAGVLASVAD